MAPAQDGTPQRIESGKQRALRIPLDYYKGWDNLHWTKIILTVILGVVALGWWVVGLFSHEHSAVMYSHGPVAKAHASIESDCAACHVPWHPITGQKGPALLLGDFHASDARCEICHGPADVSKNGAGSPHHNSQKKEDTNSCGGCHRDHQGRESSLVKLPDADCSSCHRDLKAHMDGSPHFANAVTRFEKDHPQFAPVAAKKDPSRLRFNHVLHTAAGLESSFTYRQLGEEARKKYGWKEGDDLDRVVHLECSACHTLEAKGPGAVVPDNPYGPEVAHRLEGAYLEPINYDAHCKACHPTTDQRDHPLKHGNQPAAVQKELADILAKTEPAKPPEPSAGTRVVPGNSLSAQQIREASAGDQMAKELKYLFLGRANCGECHEYKIPNNQVVPDAIDPPDIPQVWFPHALFNHKKHEKMKCLDCHGGVATSRSKDDVLVPGIENCQKCHAKNGDRTIGATTGDCIECHRYHHGNPAFMALQRPSDKRPWRDTADLLEAFASEKPRRVRR